MPMDDEEAAPLMAEYVLGLLDSAENGRLERQMRVDPALMAEYHHWIGHFAAMNSAFVPQAGGYGYEGLSARLFGVPPAPRRQPWRRWAVALVVVVVVAIKVKLILMILQALASG